MLYIITKKAQVLLSIMFLLLLNAGTALASKEQADQIILTLKAANMQVNQAEASFNEGKTEETYVLIKHLQPILAQTTELHSQLYEALKEDPKATVTAEKEKEQTIEFAKLRDRVNYLAGMVSRKQGNMLEAVKHFVLVVQSQRGTGLGKKAYSSLREMGFSPLLTLSEQQ